ncbi:MAG: hypothetical protein AAF694_24340 [Bacteroidota bacterium]
MSRKHPSSPFSQVLLGILLLGGSPILRAIEPSQIERDLLSFRLSEVAQNLGQLESEGLRSYYQFHLHFYKYLTAQTPNDLVKLRNNWDQIVESIYALPSGDSLQHILLSDMYAKKGMVEFLDKNYLKGVWSLRYSRNYLKKHQKIFPNDPNSLKMEGLFNCLFGVIPKKYHWITQTLGIKGDITKGIRQLEKAGKEGKVLPLESTLLHYFATKNLLNQPHKALKALEYVRDTFSNSILLDYCQIAGYMGIKQSQKALKILQKRSLYKDDPTIFFIPLWDYHMGRAYYYKASYPQARKMFDFFLTQHKGDLYRTDAVFRLGMSYLLDGDYEMGSSYFGQLQHQEASDLEEDEYALHLAKKFLAAKPSTPTLTLFQSRNAYDGGYYTRALSYLKPLSEAPLQMTPEELTFLYYLYGRIFHTQGKLSIAYDNYLKCIAQPDLPSSRWQQSYSSYYIGEIARNQENRELARQYYKKALTYTDYFYQSSLENQCKVALGKL